MLWNRNIVKPALIALVFIIVVGLSTVATWHQADSPWRYMETDHQNLGAMHYKNVDPNLFSRDYFFNDNRYFAYYTPSFLAFLALPASLGLDYFHAMAVLQAPLLLLYLTGAYALFWQVSKSHTIALIFALFSIIGVTALTDFWLVSGFVSILPRTMALPGVVWSAFLLMRFLNSETQGWLDGRAWWHWVILGVLLGLTPNLHPLTGLAFSMIAGIVCLARWKRKHKPALYHIIILIAATVLTALPIVLNVTGRSNRPIEVTSADFQAFAATFEGRTIMLPAAIGRLSSLSNQEQIATALLWLPFTLIPWLMAKSNQRSIAAVAFVVVQLVYVWLLIKNLDEFMDFLIIATALIFFVWRWWLKDEEQEMVYYEMMAAVAGVSFFLLIALRLIWLNFEIWPLTTMVSGLARGARLYTLPCYLIGARFALHLVRQVERRDLLWLIFMGMLSLLVPLSLWHGVILLLLVLADPIRKWRERGSVEFALWSGLIAAVSVYVVYQIVTRQDANLVAIIVGGSTAVSAYFLARWRVSESMRWGVFLLGGAIVIGILTAFNVISPLRFTNDSPWYVHVLRGAPDFITYLLGSVFALGLWLLLVRSSASADHPPIFLLSRLSPVLRDTLIFTCAVLIIVMAVQTVGLVTISLRAQPQDMPAIIEAAVWAKDNTDENALFFDSFDNGTRFRLWSLRSVTHGWTELGLIGFARPIDMAPMLERHQSIVAASQDPDETILIARDLGADYIIRGRNAPLDLPIVYSNDELHIYQLTS